MHLEMEVLRVFLEKETVAELSKNNFNSLEMEFTTPKAKIKFLNYMA